MTNIMLGKASSGYHIFEEESLSKFKKSRLNYARARLILAINHNHLRNRLNRGQGLDILYGKDR